MVSDAVKKAMSNPSPAVRRRRMELEIARGLLTTQTDDRIDVTIRDGDQLYRIFWSEEYQEYVGIHSEFPRLSWLDVNAHEAFIGIYDLIRSFRKDQERKSGQQLPPRPLLGSATGELYTERSLVGEWKEGDKRSLTDIFPAARLEAEDG